MILPHSQRYWNVTKKTETTEKDFHGKDFSFTYLIFINIYIKKLELTSCRFEQPLQGMELQKKKHKNVKTYKKSVQKESTVKNVC